MSIKVSHAALLAVIGAAAAVAPIGDASAQGSNAGSWRVTELTKPVWIEPTSAEPVVALKVGDVVVFNADSIDAIAPFGCTAVKYEQIRVPAASLFQEGIPDAAQAVSIAQSFGIAGSAQTLRANCENASFDYHESATGLVMHYDNMIYTLKKASASR